MVPNEWEEITIEDCLKDKTAMAYGILQPGEDVEDGIPMIRTVDIGDDGLCGTKIIRVNPELHEEYKRTALSGGEVLLSVMGTVGRTMVVPNECSGWNVNRALAVMRLNSKTNPEYFCAYLKSPYINDRLIDQAIGSAQKRINLGDLKKYKLRLPPLPEQKKIAQILSTWDKAITTTEQLLANSQQQKKALMQQLLTGKKRLLDKNGVRFSGEWKSYHLSHVTVIVMGSSPKSEAYNENGIGLPLLQGNADIKNRISAPRIFTSEITKECEIGDILLSVRAPVGTVAISEHKACIGRGIAALHAKPNCDQSFIYQFLLWFEPKWGTLSQGSTFESINSDDIKNLKIKVPNFGEQQKIAAVLSTADQEISALQQKLDALKQEKKALMQQLLTGKRRVVIE